VNKTIYHSGTAVTNNVTVTKSVPVTTTIFQTVLAAIPNANNVTVTKSVSFATTIFKTIVATPPKATSPPPHPITVNATRSYQQARFATSTTTILKNVPAVTTVTITKTVTATQHCTAGKIPTATGRLAPREDIGAFCRLSFRKADGTRYWEGNACVVSDTCTEVGVLENRPVYRGSNCY